MMCSIGYELHHIQVDSVPFVGPESKMDASVVPVNPYQHITARYVAVSAKAQKQHVDVAQYGQ